MVIGIVRSAACRFFVSLAMVYLALGNVPRFLPIGGGRSGILVTELLFYFSALIFLLASLSTLALPIEIIVGALVILASYFVGAVQDGYDGTALLYGLRFVLLMASAYSLGIALRRRYGEDLERALSRVFLFPLVIATLIGWVLYFLFPKSEQLWLALRLYGIEFSGDPHEHRLLSSYFDPNYFSVIAVFGVVLALELARVTRARRYIACATFLIISILFSLSRSGIATLIAVLGIMSLPQLPGLKIAKAYLFGSVAGIAAVILTYPIYSETVERMASRYFDTNLQYDGSSLARLHVAEQGFAAIRDNFLFGIGFNFVPLHYAPMTAFDSSLMQVIVTMGAIGGSLFILMLMFFSFRSLRTLMTSYWGGGKPFVLAIGAYLFVSVGFASLFNNLLFYQFWFVPVFASMTYLSGAGDRIVTDARSGGALQARREEAV